MSLFRCLLIVAAKKFTCSISNNKKSFYRSFNAIYSKVGRCASEEVLVKLISAKCLPVFIYGLDACSVSYADKHTLDFIMTRTLMRVFKTNSIQIISECQQQFNFRNVSEVVISRKCKFLQKFTTCDNLVCNLFVNVAQAELTSLTLRT